MFSKVLIGTGILIMLLTVLGVVWGIYSSFQGLEMEETAGIGAVSGGVEFALWSNILFFVGMILMIVGVIKLYKEKKSKS